MRRAIVAMLVVFMLLMVGCGPNMGVTVSQDQAEIAQMGLEMLSFNAGYLIAEKWPSRVGEIQAELATLVAVLAGNQADAANAAFQLAVQKLVGVTNNDPLVAANILFLSKKIKFVSTGEGKKVIDIPQMKLIVSNFGDGVNLRGATRR